MKTQKQIHKQAQVQAEEMAKKWATVSNYVSNNRIEFEDLDELLESLQELGINVDALQEVNGVLRSRAYTRDGRLIVEAFHHDEFDWDVWIRHPSWHVVAAVKE